MHIGTKLLFLACLFAVACSVKLPVPDEAVVRCATDAQCPKGWLCKPATGLCVIADTNESPRVELRKIERTCPVPPCSVPDEIAVPVKVIDAEGDAVELTVEVDSGSGFVPALVTGTTLQATANGVEPELRWQAQTQLGSAAYVEQLRLRVTASDAGGPGPASESEPFAYGNDAPAVLALTVDDASVSGLTVIRFAVADDAEDPVGVTSLRLSLTGTFDDAAAIPLVLGAGASFPSGSLTGLATSTPDCGAPPCEVWHTLTWDSRIVGAVDVPAARLWLVVTDVFGGVSSPPFPSEAFELNNANTSPEIVFTGTPSGTIRVPLATVDYEISDADQDLCVLAAEYSVDGGAHWDSAASASTTVGLESCKTDSDTCSHQFGWQTSQLPGGIYPDVRLRFRASDGKVFGAWVTTPAFVVDTHAAAAPLVQFESVGQGINGRPLTDVPFVVRVFDDDTDLVTLVVEYSVGGEPEWVRATLDLATTDLESLPTGVAHPFTWRALVDAEADGSDAFATVDVDTNVDGSTHATVLAARSETRLRITPTDETGRTGIRTVFIIQALGNSVPGATLASPSGLQADDVPLEFRVQDPETDNVRVLLQFRQSASDVWRSPDLTLGSVTDLVTDDVGPGRPYLVLWNSRATLDNATLTNEQGIGAQNLSTVEIRIRAVDAPIVGVEHFGAWSTPVAGVHIRNLNMAPSLTLVTPPTGTISDDVTVTYTVADEESDPVGLLVEYWTDANAEWFGAVPGEGGDGIVGLASAPGGTTHTYVWSSTQIGYDVTTGVRLRLRVFDSQPSSWQSTAFFAVDNRNTVNSPPSVSVSTVAPAAGVRYMNRVNVPFTLADPNGQGVGTDTVSVAVEYSLDGTTWHTATRHSTSSSITGLAAAPTGTLYQFVWDAIADLPDALLNTTEADDVGDTAIVVGNAQVQLRFTPTDSNASPKTGVAATSSAFALGNDPPTATITLLPSSGGDYAVRFQVRDPQSDLSDVQIQFRQHASDVWRAAKISVGTLSQLATTPAGSTYVALWESNAPLNSDVAVAQGIGPTVLSTVQLRMRANDKPDGVTRHYGPWSTGNEGLTVDNQTPPRVEPVYVKSDGDVRTGVIPIVYRLIDAEADLVDVAFELSQDGGSTWHACTEYYAPESEGRFNLQAAPETDTTGVGVHTFLWDSRANLFARSSTVQVRATAHDGVAVGPSAIVLPSSVVGPPDVAPNGGRFDAPVEIASDPALLWLKFPTLVDLDHDGALDVVIADTGAYWGGTDSIAVLTGNWSAGRPDGTFSLVGTFPVGGVLGDPAVLVINDLAVADVNEDGIYDVVTIANFTSDVRVMLGNGSGGAWDGTLATPIPYSLAEGVDLFSGYDLEVADLDTDGVLDLVVSATTGSRHGFFVLLGEGADGAETGTFAAPVYYSTSVKGPVVVGNFDNQNGPDIAHLFAGSVGCWFSVFLGQGGGLAGTFPVRNEYSAGSSGCESMAKADFNADGLEDLAFEGASDPAVYVALSTGSGFTATGSGRTLGSASGLTTGDVNNDGTPDLIVFEGGGLAVVLSDTAAGIGTGKLGNPIAVQPSALDGASSVTAGDVNRDGNLDFVVGTYYKSGKIYVVSGATGLLAGPGMASEPRVFYGRSAQTEVVFDDVDADGVLDMGHYEGYMRNERRGFVGTGNLSFAWINSTGGMAAGDFNNDNLIDQIVYYSRVRLRSGPPPAFGTGAWVDLPVESTIGRIVVDLDQDGFLDIVMAGYVTAAGAQMYPHVWAFRGNGDGTFSSILDRALSSTHLDSPSTVLVGHLNADGFADIVVPTSLSGLHVILADGAGGFAATTTYAFRGGHAALCDVNNDGVLDLWVADSPYPNHVVKLALGLDTGTPGAPSGSFNVATPLTISYPTPVSAVQCLDLNGDGHVDLVTGHIQEHAFRVHMGHGDGTFDGPVMLETSSNPVTFAAADLDSDGTLDLVVPDRNTANYWLHTTRQEDARYQWLRGLSPWGSSTPLGTYVGPGTLLGGHSRFGATDPRYDGMSVRRWHGVHEAGFTAARGTGWGASFKDMLLQAHLTPAPPSALLPITDAWYASGDIHLSRVDDPAFGGVTDVGARIRVDARLGPRTAPTATTDFTQAGLSLTGGWGAQRGIVVHLPIAPDAGVVTASKVHLYRRVTGWLRADELLDPSTGQPFDPMGTQSGAHAYLPRAAVAAGDYRDIVLPTHEWTAIPSAADLTVGTGPRFDVYYTDEGQGYVRVLTDELGVFQAFLSD